MSDDRNESDRPTGSRFPYNPAHEVGTCAKCGREMRYNVPRLGPDGGYVHKDTGKLDCQTMPNDGGQRPPAWGGISEPPCSAMSCGDGPRQFPGPVMGGRGVCRHCGEAVNNVAYHEANACKRGPNASLERSERSDDTLQDLVGRRCSCGLFALNWGKLHESCEHAALNGLAISIPAIRYCPWCGCLVPPNAAAQVRPTKEDVP